MPQIALEQPLFHVAARYVATSAGNDRVEDGGVESSTYATPLEQAETFPAASVAVARNVVAESSATATASPGEENAAAVPVAASALVHVPLV